MALKRKQTQVIETIIEKLPIKENMDQHHMWLNYSPIYLAFIAIDQPLEEKLALIKKLIARGFNPSKAMCSMRIKDIENNRLLFEYLLELGGNINTQDKEGHTLTMRLFDKILNDLNVQKYKEGQFLKQAAVEQRYLDHLKFLKKHGAQWDSSLIQTAKKAFNLSDDSSSIIQFIKKHCTDTPSFNGL